jgi:K+-transporting ATPase KdpF subunit
LQPAILMGTLIIGIIAALLLVYLFAAMIYPEKF